MIIPMVPAPTTHKFASKQDEAEADATFGDVVVSATSTDDFPDAVGRSDARQANVYHAGAPPWLSGLDAYHVKLLRLKMHTRKDKKLGVGCISSPTA
jgi:hypothetical protein